MNYVCIFLNCNVINFTIFYVGHKCNHPGCRSALVLDGNMKNQRDVCMAKDAGFVEFTSLPGKIKTGCVHTPAHKNRFCLSYLNHSFSDTDETGHGKDCVLELILSKKTTRNEDYYEVCNKRDEIAYELNMLICH